MRLIDLNDSPLTNKKRPPNYREALIIYLQTPAAHFAFVHLALHSVVHFFFVHFVQSPGFANAVRTRVIRGQRYTSRFELGPYGSGRADVP